MKSAEEILYEKGTKIISVSEQTTIDNVIRTMLENKIGAIIVKENEEVIGIWTERDLLRNISIDKVDTESTPVKDLMTKGIISAPHDDTVYNLMDKFLGKRLRHLLIEKNGKYIGLLSIGDVIKATLQEKSDELNDLKTMVSWDYYEDWKWSK
ncbi:MAG: CBS domain-containing protein [Candidatus Aminicenantes bacterium]|nr:CBS domain-containing protein [Candidatus Aminicenantes bacterium]